MQRRSKNSVTSCASWADNSQAIEIGGGGGFRRYCKEILRGIRMYIGIFLWWWQAIITHIFHSPPGEFNAVLGLSVLLAFWDGVKPLSLQFLGLYKSELCWQTPVGCSLENRMFCHVYSNLSYLHLSVGHIQLQPVSVVMHTICLGHVANAFKLAHPTDSTLALSSSSPSDFINSFATDTQQLSCSHPLQHFGRSIWGHTPHHSPGPGHHTGHNSDQPHWVLQATSS